MKIQTVWAVYYSATGTTERLVEAMAEAAGQELSVPVERIRFTTPTERSREHVFGPNDLVIVGSPTYAGRLPNKIAPDFQLRLHGNGTPVIPVVLFGNRSFDHALAELCALLAGNGFHSIGAGAFVGRHAFTDELGFGRPDSRDRAQAADLVRRSVKKLGDELPPAIAVPGTADAPYYVPKGTDGQPVNFLKAKPVTDLSRCSGCGACARICPMGVIDPRDVSKVTGVCIKCCACIHRCTRRAKSWNDPAFLSHRDMLIANFRERQENQCFV